MADARDFAVGSKFSLDLPITPYYMRWRVHAQEPLEVQRLFRPFTHHKVDSPIFYKSAVPEGNVQIRKERHVEKLREKYGI